MLKRSLAGFGGLGIVARGPVNVAEHPVGPGQPRVVRSFGEDLDQVLERLALELVELLLLGDARDSPLSVGHLEDAKSAASLGVHHPLRNPLTVELLHLLHHVGVLQQDRSARADGERVLVAGSRNARVERRVRAVGGLQLHLHFHFQ